MYCCLLLQINCVCAPGSYIPLMMFWMMHVGCSYNSWWLFLSEWFLRAVKASRSTTWQREPRTISAFWPSTTTPWRRSRPHVWWAAFTSPPSRSTFAVTSCSRSSSAAPSWSSSAAWSWRLSWPSSSSSSCATGGASRRVWIKAWSWAMCARSPSIRFAQLSTFLTNGAL